eukprot:scaffold269815_cov32-Tisochrysis_lutea.AAC.1
MDAQIPRQPVKAPRHKVGSIAARDVWRRTPRANTSGTPRAWGCRCISAPPIPTKGAQPSTWSVVASGSSSSSHGLCDLSTCAFALYYLRPRIYRRPDQLWLLLCVA